MNADILMLFDQTPGVLPLYEALEARILGEFPDVTIRTGKTQIGFRNKYGFAYAWPPVRRVKGWPQRYLGLTFGLERRVVHPRIVEAVEAYPNRWTHHTLITSVDELDEQIMDWLRQAYHFSLLK